MNITCVFEKIRGSILGAAELVGKFKMEDEPLVWTNFENVMVHKKGNF